MNSYSFIEEAATSDVLAIGGMTTLGINTGGLIGKKVGEITSDIRNNNLNPKKISWYDPTFRAIVKQSITDAKNAISSADDWYNSCDIVDKAAAKQQYDNAVKIYRQIQRDISLRKPNRWLPAYKEALKKQRADKYQQNGNIIGGTIGFGSGASAIALNRIIKNAKKLV